MLSGTVEFRVRGRIRRVREEEDDDEEDEERDEESEGAGEADETERGEAPLEEVLSTSTNELETEDAI